MLTAEFKKDVKQILADHKNYDVIDAYIEKFNDFANANSSDINGFINKLEEIDPRLALIRLFGNYHYQVNNGGHAQYFFNGYAAADHYERDTAMHEMFIDLFKQYVPNTAVSAKVLHILTHFLEHVYNAECECCEGTGYTPDEDVECPDCGGTGYITDENGEEEECYTCNGSGTVVEEGDRCYECGGTGELDQLDYHDNDNIDQEYYDIEDAFLKEFNALCESWLNDETDGKRNEFADVKQKPAKPYVKLIGTDGNAFMLIAKCVEALRKSGADQETIMKFRSEAMSGDYDNVLVTCMKYCDVH